MAHQFRSYSPAEKLHYYAGKLKSKDPGERILAEMRVETLSRQVKPLDWQNYLIGHPEARTLKGLKVGS